jgi:uncharacterized protein (TIGR03435 family)
VLRPIVDKTGLSGSYRVSLIYDRRAPQLTPDTATLVDAGPTVFAAVRQQLGPMLRSSKAQQDTLIVDHIERPTED